MTEQQRYEVLGRFPGFEVRRYAEHLIAEVEIEGSFEDAGNRAFGVLVAYISGRNRAGDRLAMTAPVVQQAAPTRIAMTAPVLQAAAPDPSRHRVAFVMPAGFTLDTLPVPTDPRITVRQVPAQIAAAVVFSGRWSERTYRERLDELLRALEQSGLAPVGPPLFARFDPPWTPWFLRRNEVVAPLGGWPGTTDGGKTA